MTFSDVLEIQQNIVEVKQDSEFIKALKKLKSKGKKYDFKKKSSRTNGLADLRIEKPALIMTDSPVAPVSPLKTAVFPKQVTTILDPDFHLAAKRKQIVFSDDESTSNSEMLKTGTLSLSKMKKLHGPALRLRYLLLDARKLEQETSESMQKFIELRRSVGLTTRDSFLEHKPLRL